MGAGEIHGHRSSLIDLILLRCLHTDRDLWYKINLNSKNHFIKNRVAKGNTEPIVRILSNTPTLLAERCPVSFY